MRTYVFPFGPGAGSGEAEAPPTALLGGTGAALAGLARDRFPVPPGFTISAEVCACYVRHGSQYPAGVWDQIRAQIRRLEGLAVSGTDEGRRPLVLTVRVDASVPMPAAVRNPVTIGFGDRSVPAFARATGAPFAAGRGYAALIRNYGILVEGIPPSAFDEAHEAWRLRHEAGGAAAGDVDGWRTLCDACKRVFVERIRRPFPQELAEQLRGVLGAMFDAWTAPRQSLPNAVRSAGLVGAAVTVTTAVFGDLGEGSAAGAACSRNPRDGSAGPSGHLILADSEEQPLSAMASARDTQVRAAHASLRQLLVRIERRAGQPQEVEFVVEKGRLWIVHARPPCRSPAAGLRWAAEMAGGRDLETGRSLPRALTPDAALLTLSPSDLDPVPVETARGVRNPARRAFDQVLTWAGARATVEIQCHADGVDDARTARDLGAAGIGLLHPAGLLAAGPAAAAAQACLRGEDGAAGGTLRTALGDAFEQILAILTGHPVVLAVPPAGSAGCPAAVRAIVLRAFVEAALKLGRRRVRPRIALALDAESPEAFDRDLEAARAAMDLAHRASRTRVRCPVGAILPVPRAVMTADAIAERADFLVLPVPELDACMRGRPPHPAPAPAGPGDGPHRFDAEGLGALIEAGLKRGRTARPGLPCAVSVAETPDAHLLRFCLRAGIGQVICPPSSLAAARLAAAQAAIRSGARQF